MCLLWFCDGYTQKTKLIHAQVKQRLQPAPASLAAVQRWMGEHGVHWEHIKKTPAQDILEVPVSVGTAEQLLNTSYYRLTRGNHTILRSDSYTLPSSVALCVDMVGPTTTLPSPTGFVRTSQPDAGFTTPTSLRTLYGAAGTKGTAANNSFAVTGFLDQYFDPSDLAYFFKTYDKGVLQESDSII
jgi:tripeptidyl-peptidase-1